MIKIPLFLICLLAMSCQAPTTHSIVQSSGDDLTDLSVVVIDSCEYLQFRQYMYSAIEHKGNCKFCASRSIKLFMKDSAYKVGNMMFVK